MRQTFDKSVPLVEQRLRVANMKQKGWKHGTKRRSWEAKEAAKSRAEYLLAKRRKMNERVREYWLGERENYPQ